LFLSAYSSTNKTANSWQTSTIYLIRRMRSVERARPRCLYTTSQPSAIQLEPHERSLCSSYTSGRAVYMEYTM
jgi:hypothetical protein